MATTIVTKSGSGAPTASDLVAGELAVDLTNGRLYTEDSGGTVLELGLNPSGNVDVTGTVTATGTSVFASLDISGDIDVDGTTNLDVVDIDGAVDMASTLGVTGVATLASLVATTADINAGTIDGTVIGGATAAAISGTTGQFATSLNVDGTVTADGLTVDGLAQISAQTNGAYALRVGDAEGSGGGVQGIGKIGINPQGAGSFTYTGTEIRATELGTSGYRAGLGFYTRGDNSDVEPLKRLDIASNGDISFYEDTGTTPKFFWDASAESLGIGTNLPAYKLDVQGGAISAGNGTIKTGISYDTAGRLGTFSNHVLKLITNNTERMTIDAGGSVLIGKTTPTDLHNTWNHIIIGEKGAIISENGAGGIDGITLADNAYVDSDTGTYAYQTAAAASQITQSGGAITFSNAASGSAGAALTPVPRMTLDASGNLLVGRTSTFTFSTNTTDGIVLSPTRIDVSSASLCRISQIRNSVGTYDRFYNNAAIVGSISGTTTATAYNTSSDQRLKENIEDADDAGAKIDSIQVRKFDWKVDGSHQDYGMVAQELLEVAPEAVSAPEDPEEMMGVDYSKLVPMMLKEIQSLRARIAALES